MHQVPCFSLCFEASSNSAENYKIDRYIDIRETKYCTPEITQDLLCFFRMRPDRYFLGSTL